MSLSQATIIELDFTDSTNNYAMSLIDGNKAQHGMVIVAESQTNGKGQRGRTWIDEPGQSLLMSMITYPKHPLTDQFLFNACVSVAIAKVLQKIHNDWQVRIKWPNDIIVNDKKAGGVLIENVIRGSLWTHSVIGLGLNIRQENFPDSLPFATSLKIASGKDFTKRAVLHDIQQSVMLAVDNIAPPAEQIALYNQLLYKMGQKQGFSDISGNWQATILNAMPDGSLQVQLNNGDIVAYTHGQVLWNYAF